MCAMKNIHTQLSVHLVSHSSLQADWLESDGADLFVWRLYDKSNTAAVPEPAGFMLSNANLPLVSFP